MRSKKIKALVAVGVLMAVYAIGGDIRGLFSAEESDYTRGGAGSPWIRQPIRRVVKSKLSELEVGTVERAYRQQAEVLRGIDLRKDPLDLRYEHISKALSEIKPGYYRPDPFAFPGDLPEEFRPPGEVLPQTPEAILAQAALKLRREVCTTMTVRGVFYTPSGRLVVVSQRGLEGIPTSSSYLGEGSTLPLGLLDFVPPGTLFQEGASIMGMLRVETIREGYILFKVGAFLERQPEKIVWETLTYYRSMRGRGYSCE